MSRRVIRSAAAAALSLATLASCSADTSTRYSREKAQQSLEKLESPGLVIGEFALGARPVTDGDTIRVDGLDSSLRLLGLDCEETFKNEQDRRDAESDFEAYLVDRRGGSKHPVKYASPLGEEAKAWAKQFFADVDTVRLERDHPRDIRDRYNRYLAYAIALKGGKWINYNVEAVRAGMSPYFSKYGYSRRFHDEFVAAEAEAREHKRGIWDPAKQHARDYDERKVWWDARGDFVREFDREAEGRDDHIIITNWDAMRRLEKMVGKEVTVLGTVGDIRLGDRGPTKVFLSRRMFSDLPLIFFDKDVYGSSQIGRWKGEFVKVRGTVSKYRYKASGREEMQIVINTPGQITMSTVPGLDPDDLGDPDAGEADE